VSPNKKHIPIALFLIIFLTSISLVVSKAILAPITHDESISILIWSSSNIFDVWGMNSIHNTPPDANNHILNSVLIKISENFFGFNELAHRAPNILSFLIFLVYLTLSINHLTKDRILISLAIPAGFLYIGFLDFFSLARGYGISFSFLIASIYYALIFNTHRNNFDLIKSQIFAIFSVLANFASINFFAAQFFIIFFIILFGSKTKRARQLILLATTSLIALLLIAPPVLKLINSKALYFGESTGLFNAVFGTLIAELSGRNSGFFEFFLITTLISAIIIKIYSASTAAQKPIFTFREISTSTYAALLIFLIIILIQLQHLIFSTPYITRRATLYLWPVIFLFLIATFIEFKATTYSKKIFLVCFNSIIVVHFIINWSATKTAEWAYDVNTPEVYALIYKNCINKPQTTIGTNWIYVPALNYEIIKNSKKCENLSTRYEAIHSADYYYITKDDISHIQASIKNYKLIKTFNDGALLYKK